MSLDFLGLKVTFHLSAQLEFFCKSLFNIPVVILGSSPTASNEVSSAKLSILALGKRLMITTKYRSTHLRSVHLISTWNLMSTLALRLTS